MARKENEHSDILIEEILGDIDHLKADISALLEEALQAPEDFDKINAIGRLVRDRAINLCVEANLIVKDQIEINGVQTESKLSELLGENGIHLCPSDLQILNSIFINSLRETEYRYNILDALALTKVIKARYGVTISQSTLLVYLTRLRDRLERFDIPLRIVRDKTGYVLVPESNS